jgi:hypothetical protein
MRTACSVLSRVASASAVAQPERARTFERFRIGVDHHHLIRRLTAGEQFVECFRAGDSRAGDYDVPDKACWMRSMRHFSQDRRKTRAVGRADENENEEDADRSHHERVEHARPAADRHDVAIARRGDADRCEIKHVVEIDHAVMRVLEAVAFDPVDEHGKAEQRYDEDHAPRNLHPYRHQARPPQRDSIGPAGACHRRSSVSLPNDGRVSKIQVKRRHGNIAVGDRLEVGRVARRFQHGPRPNQK